MRRSEVAAWFLIGLLSVKSSAGPAAGTLSFGWAWADITPQKPVALCGQYRTRISGQVHDRIGATALALQSRYRGRPVDHAVVVSCDVVGIRRCIVRQVRKRLGGQVPDLDPSKIVICATHTHTAPALTDAQEAHWDPYDFAGSWAYRIPKGRADVMRPAAYKEFLVERLCRVIQSAWHARQPGEVSWALSHAVVAHNRRAVYRNGKARMYGDVTQPDFSHIEGASDHSVDLLFFMRKKHLAGIVIVLYCPSQEVEGQNYISADFWYDTRKLLQKNYGREIFVLPLCGAAGDQSPHVMWNKKAEAAHLSQVGRSSRQEIAFRVARAVDRVISEALSHSLPAIRFRHLLKEVPLPVWKVSGERMLRAQAVYEAGKGREQSLSSPEYINWRVSGALLARYERQSRDPFYRAELHFLRLGDFAFATNPFELYGDWAMRIKARSAASQTAVVQLASDCAGYLPTRRAVEAGGYSARIVDGIVGPEGGEVLVVSSVKALAELWGGR